MQKKNIFQGLITALITPFKNNKIDYEVLEVLLQRQIDAQVDGVVIAGSTGEGGGLSADEYYAIIKAACVFIKGRIPVIAGVNTISTMLATDVISKLEKYDIDGIMCVTPPYIRPTQEGLYQHYKQIHDNSLLPIMLYTVPKRTGSDFIDETIIRLSEFTRIKALKDAAGDVEKPLRLANKLPDDFNLLTGDDGNTVAYNVHGGRGCVSVASNVWTRQCVDVQRACDAGNFVLARQLQVDLIDMYKVLFTEPNPIGIKCAAHLAGLCSDEIRLPLTKATSKLTEMLRGYIK